MKNPNDTTRNRICDLPDSLPQQTALPRTPVNLTGDTEFKSESINTVIDSAESTIRHLRRLKTCRIFMESTGSLLLLIYIEIHMNPFHIIMLRSLFFKPSSLFKIPIKTFTLTSHLPSYSTYTFHLILLEVTTQIIF
jgi:hypothetical protein